MQQRVVSTVKFQWMLCLLVSLCLNLWSTTPLFAQATDETGRIAGIVTNEEGVPLAGIEVRPYRYAPDNEYRQWVELPEWEVTTDDAGAYLIPVLEPGVYTVRFFDPNQVYALLYYNDSMLLTAAVSVLVEEGQTTHGINAMLRVGGTLTGYVAMYDGTPASKSTTYLLYDWEEDWDADIDHHGHLWLEFFDGYGWIQYDEVLLNETDSQFDMATSTFQIAGLATGEYQLSFTGYHKGVPISQRSEANEFTGYYERAAGPLDATKIQVTEGERSTIEVIIGDTPTLGRIRGRITDQANTPLAGIEVQLFRYGQFLGDWYPLFRSDFSATDGTYELREIPLGEYAVRFFDPNETYALQFANHANIMTETIFTMTPGLVVEEVDAMLLPTSRVTGQLRFHDQSEPLDPLLKGRLNLAHVDRTTGVSSLFELYLSWLDDNESHFDPMTGNFTFGGLTAGVYRLLYDHPNDAYDRWFTMSVPAITTLPIDIVADDPQMDAIVRGVVTDEAGQPVGGIHVVATTKENYTEYTRHAVTDADGSYELSATIAGWYKLEFYDPSGHYGFQYYPKSEHIDDAERLLLKPGTNLSNVDAILSVAGRIAGDIIMRNQPLSAIGQHPGISVSRVNDWVSGSRNLVVTTTVFVQTEGNTIRSTYEIAGLPSGTYHVCTYIKLNENHCYENANNFSSATDIPVTAGTTTRADIISGNDNQRVLALYALALDHDPDRIDNLAPQLAPAMQSIIAATRDQPNKTAVVLADAAGVGDTRVYVVQNGRATPVQGLPNAAFQLDPTLTEANMADGATLGNFIRWARNTYLAEVTLFGFVGHGAPLVPATGFADIVAASGGIRPFGPTDLTANLFPLPSRVDAYPSLTDNHPEALITPHDLATALRIGSNNGADPLQIADIAHCFSASIEELYELSPNGDQPYAEIILASPTYTYLDPPALGQALGAINTLMTPATMADQILRTYDSLIEQADLSDGDADVEHPRLLVAVNSRQVARVKADWDKVAYALLQNFDGEKLRQAYLASPKYDTTLCRPQDWALSPPDALSDLDGFAVALRQVYGAESAVGQAATTVIRDLEESAILSRYQRNGTPWYAPQNAQFWNFDQHKGIALYTDLQGMPTAKAATVELSWQSRWYTADTLGGENPHPYAFVQNGADGVTWADLFAEFWRRQPNVTIQTALCFPELASDPQTGALRAVVITSPVTDTMRVGLPFTPVAVVAVEQATLKPKVRFNLYDATQTLLFSDTVQAGYWLTGTHQIAAARAYTPTAPGSITVEVTVDPTNGFIESDESDNHLVHAYTVAAATNLFPLAITAQLAEPALFVSSDRVQLQAAITPVDLATTLEVQLYQFTDNATSAPWQPVLRDGQLLDREHPELLLDGLSPGVVLLHIWARTADGSYSATPALVEFNYAPANQLLAAGQRHIYRLPPDRLPAPVNGATQLNLALSRGRADLFAWSPFNQWGPEWSISAPGDAPLILPATTSAEGYLLELYAITETQYTLTAQPTANPPTTVNAMDDDSHYRPTGKPFLIEPVSMAPGRGRLVAGRQFFLPLVSR